MRIFKTLVSMLFCAWVGLATHAWAQPRVTREVEAMYPRCRAVLTRVFEQELGIDPATVRAIGLFTQTFQLIADSYPAEWSSRQRISALTSTLQDLVRSPDLDPHLRWVLDSMSSVPNNNTPLLTVLVTRDCAIEGDATLLETDIYPEDLRSADPNRRSPALLVMRASDVGLPHVFLPRMLHELTHYNDSLLLDAYARANLALPNEQRDRIFNDHYDLARGDWELTFEEYFLESRAFWTELRATDRIFLMNRPRSATDTQTIQAMELFQRDVLEALTNANRRRGGYLNATRFVRSQRIPPTDVFSRGVSLGQQMQAFVAAHPISARPVQAAQTAVAQPRQRAERATESSTTPPARSPRRRTRVRARLLYRDLTSGAESPSR